MSKKTITIVYNTSAYVYKFRMNLIKKLQEKGFHVVVMAPRDAYVEQIKSKGIGYYEIRISQYGMNPFKEIGTIYQLWKGFKKYRPVVSLHYTIKPNIFGNIAAFFSRTPVINNIAGAGKAFSIENRLFLFFIESLFRFSLRFSKKVFFQNNDDRTMFIEKHLVAEEKTERIPGSGVDLQKYNVPQTRVTRQNNIFLFVGRLLKQKGIVEYLEAATEIKRSYQNVQFLIVGEYEALEDYISAKALKDYCDDHVIKYLGSVSPDTMPSILEGSDCVVLPSYYHEGVPRSLLEAAAMGKPIITTNNVGCKEVVDDGVNGFKCNPKDAQCIAKAMKIFIEMPAEKRMQMGRNGRVKMEKEFDEKCVLDRYVKTVEEISANQKTRKC